jgi:uncharacterized protein with ParB-like and HNH nuclease domain
MKSNPRSILDLFDVRHRYLIPLFQRQYVWEQEKQWEPLWEDIQAKVSEYIDGKSDVHPHFLGAIVLNHLPYFGNEVPPHDVIDGQQRLTTFQLFLAAFRDLTKAKGDEDIANEIRRLTANPGLKAHPDEEFKVWPTTSDQDCFRAVLKAGSREAIEEKYPPVYVRKKLQPRPRMVEAYLYFYESIDEFIESSDSSETMQRLQSLYYALKSLQVVSIELEGEDDPQVIFETLNARGEPLLSSDLLRNFIFMRAYREKESAKDLYDNYWLEFDVKPDGDGKSDQRFWKVEERQGRLLRPRLDLFIQHFLSLKTQHDVNATKLYQSYRKWIQEKKPFTGIEEELQELHRYANIFERFYAPDPSNRMGVFASRLRLLDTSTLYPLLLHLEADQNLPSEDRDGIAEDLESFLVRRLVCGLTTKNYNNLFLQLLRAASESGSLSRATFRQILLEQKGDAVVWPDDERFRRAWLTQPVYRLMKSSRRVEMILRAIEDFVRDNKKEKFILLGKLTVEHVMPQSWQENWPLPHDGKSPEDASYERDEIIHTLGNLTLLTQELNSSVGNAPFEIRRPEITKHSALHLNVYFQDRQTWNESAILERGAFLFETAVKLWPYPVTSDAKVVPQAPSEVTAPVF